MDDVGYSHSQFFKSSIAVKQLSGNIHELSLSKMNQTESKKAKN